MGPVARHLGWRLWLWGSWPRVWIFSVIFFLLDNNANDTVPKETFASQPFWFQVFHIYTDLLLSTSWMHRTVKKAPPVTALGISSTDLQLQKEEGNCIPGTHKHWEKFLNAQWAPAAQPIYHLNVHIIYAASNSLEISKTIRCTSELDQEKNKSHIGKPRKGTQNTILQATQRNLHVFLPSAVKKEFRRPVLYSSRIRTANTPAACFWHSLPHGCWSWYT